MVLLFQVNYTHVIEFHHLFEDMKIMLPQMDKTFQALKLSDVRLNVNRKSPPQNLNLSLHSLGPRLFQKLCSFYEKDFVVFGYPMPS